MFNSVGSRAVSPNHALRAQTSGGIGRPVNNRLLDSVDAKDFGATGNGLTDDTIALQNAINAAQNAFGAELYIPAGKYKITAQLNVTKHLAIRGAGSQNIGNLAGVWQSGGGVTPITAVTAGTAILPSSTIAAFVINTPDTVQIRDLAIAYLTVATPATGTTAINFGISAGNSNFGSLIENVVISGADRGVQFTNCLSQIVRGCTFWECQSYSVFVSNTAGSSIASTGDYAIEGNTFVSGSTASMSHFYAQSGGGMRIVGNKFNTAGSVNNSYGININPTSSGVSIEPVVITGNSIEGVRVGIQFSPGNATATITQSVIAGNQIWGSNSGPAGISGRAIQLTAASASFGQPTSGVIIAGNFLNVDGGGTSSTSIIYIQNTSNVNIASNVYGVVSSAGTTALSQTSSLNSNINTNANAASPGVV